MIRLAIWLGLAGLCLSATTTWDNSRRPQNRNDGCNVDVRLDISGQKPPVFLVADSKGEWTLAGPTQRTKYNSYMNLANKKILLTCPGQNNKLKLGNSEVNEAEATCSSTDGVANLVINGKSYKIDSLKCKERVTPYEYISNERCNGDGTILKLGYMINNKIHDLITVCHRLADGMTYFSSHILDGSHFPQRGNGGKRHDEEGRPQFSFHNRALFKGFPPYKYYKDAVELSALSQAIGSSAAQSVFNPRDDKFFAKGHLSPNADFMLENWRDVTFLFVNVQPQWQEVNGGNWNEVEIATRYNAAATGKKYQVITGTAGHLTPKSKSVSLDTDNERIPVPESYTKLIREVDTNKCIAFVSTNFPQNDAPAMKCRDICAANKWPSLKSAAKEGFVYCCSYEEFLKNFAESAPRVDCSGGVLVNENKG
ncbi:Endonuclease_NS [Nesidiocoris tenuis]|uniref:Endonuclease_NS n=1 Tax=Nesidiocoris tenuis TaxID=355587 RepID=A0ABN7BE40_9HEMI|nr:Endonuclease_NS [Nesidiocoris tenuis]